MNLETKEKKIKAFKVLKPIKQKLTIKDAILKDQLNEEAKNEIEKIKEIEETVHSKKLIYETNNYVYNFQQFETIKYFTNLLKLL